jgi:hypothetical protein
MSTNSLELVNLINNLGDLVPGLVPVSDNPDPSLSISERAAIYSAKTFHRIDYVFFRRFNDERSSQITAYVVDNRNENLSKVDLAELHRQVWLHGSTPFIYVA